MSKVIYHLTTEHIFYLIHNQCYLSLKADGYYKSEKIEEIDKICEFESVNDKKLIFNILNDKTNIQKKIFNLAKNLNIKYPDEFEKELTNDNFDQIMDKYVKFFENINVSIIPKFYLKINKKNFIPILKKISNYFPTTEFSNDGWVIIPENEKYIAKLKPKNHLTIDLKFKNNKFFANNWEEVIISKNCNVKNNSVYRCYWNKNKWNSIEERTDKRYGNNIYIIEIITNYLNKSYGFDYFEHNDITQYYSHNKFNNNEFIEYFIFMKKFTQDWISKFVKINNKIKLLDVGCGKISSYKMLSEIGINNIVGIDSDPICIFKSMIASRSNNYIWIDINYNWSIRDQIKKFGNIWENSQLYKLKNLHNKFDIILFNFSIFYCKIINYEKLINNLNKISLKGTYLFFNYIDYDSASDDLIRDFKINHLNNELININLPWKNKIHEEPKFNNTIFEEHLIKNNWNKIDKRGIVNKYEKFKDWQNLLIYQIWEKN